MAITYSRNQIKNAGKRLRDLNVDGRPITLEDFRRSVEILDSWRASHALPLAKATMGLRSRVATERCADARVSQRLKRRPTMIDKLVRQPNMQLTTMHDIAGCRAILESVDEVKRVRQRWHRKKGRVVREYDYLTRPKASGYRGFHLVVEYDGLMIEVQLRTKLQHAWGTAVEQVGAAIKHDLKSGQGPEEILLLFQHLGDLLAQEDGLAEFSADTIFGLRGVAAAVPERVLVMVGLRLTPTGFEFTTTT